MKPYQLVAALMEDAKLGSLPLAKKLRKPELQPSIHRFIKGNVANPNRSTAAPIAEFFNIPVDALYDEEVATSIARQRGLTTKGQSGKPPPADGIGKVGESNVTETGSKADTASAVSQSIPTSMIYSAPNLKSAILLIGSLLGALDERSRKLTGELLKDLASHPDEAQDIAEKASVLATVQKPITKNKALNRALQGRNPVETQPAPLEEK